MPVLARIADRILPWRRRRPVIGVVRLSGVIRPTGPMQRSLNLQTAGPLLEAAFAHRRTAAVALSINSPGGSPVQADLIQRRVRDLARKSGKPVIAFCEDVAASGGYWLALAADEIYAHHNSLVGSIGVVSAGFGLDRAIGRLGIDRRLHTSGQNKGMLDPFSPEQPEHVARLRALQAELHDSFRQWVRERRGKRLKGDEQELFSGAFWTGRKAQEYGLIDGLGDLHSVLRQRYGERVRLQVFSRRPGLAARLGLARGGLEELPGAVLAALEERTLWTRFGL